MNKVILIGRLARDPELRTTPSNISVATFSIAVSRPFTQAGVQPETDFINCVVWRRGAENLAKYCRKGSQIAVEGRIQTRNYTANDGSKRYVTEVLCENVTFLGSKADNQGNADNYQNNSYVPNNNYAMDNNNFENNSIPVDNYNSEMQSSDVSLDPFKDFGEEVTLSDDDLPF